MTFEVVFFCLVSAAALLSALMMVTRPNPIKGVLFLIVNFFCLALLYLLLQAQFIAVIQILVYAGAIMVLFVFVIMLLNLEDEKLMRDGRGVRRTLALLFGIGLAVELVAAIVLGATARSAAADAVSMGTVEAIGKVLFTEYVVPFEATSLLLLAALVGVVVLAKRRLL
jgi:NADH-quinone oxidoreductase subunit J